MNQRLTDQAIEERRSWQYRALAYTHGNQSQIGALIVAMLGRTVNPPCFHTGGIRIMKDGRCLALYKNEPGGKWAVECIYHSVDVLTTAFRGLAQVLHLSEAEQEAMFSELRKFVFKDDRAKSFLPGITDEEGNKL